MKPRLAFALLAFLLASAPAFAGTDQPAPTILWASSPVAPGETILVHGGDFGSNPQLEIRSAEKTAVLHPVSVSETALMFAFPKDWQPCEVSARVLSDERSSNTYLINTPDIWWVQGDWGTEASPGGWVRLFGRCIESPQGHPREFFLTDESGMPVSGLESQEEINRWSQKIILAHDIAEGTYCLAWKDSATGGACRTAPFKVTVHRDVWKTDVFNITDYGAVANDQKDDTEAILKAAEALKNNGGGILFVPRGRFCMTKTIILPPYSALQGVSQDLSEIYWPDTDDPPQALVMGDHSFGVENIFLTSGFHRDGISDSLSPEECGWEPHPKGNVTLRNMTMRLLYCEYVNNDLEKAKKRLETLHYYRALRLRGLFVRVTDCDVYAAAGGVFEFGVRWSEISGNRFSHANLIGWNGFRGQHLIFENNHFGGSNCTSFYGIPEMSENVYWGHNYHENAFDGNNRETVTGDCRDVLYIDTAEIPEPNQLVLDMARIRNDNYAQWMHRGVVQICAGRGVGQFRRIVSMVPKDGKIYLKLDRSWDIAPDESSVFYIGTCRGRFIYTGNEANDSTVALQLYGSMMESVIADNVTRHTGGYHADTMFGETSWFIEMLNNTVSSGTYYRGPFNEVPATDAHVALISNGAGFGDYDYPLMRSSLIRDCKLLGNAFLEVRGFASDIVVENNLVRDADVGLRITNRPVNVHRNGNRFENVDVPEVESK